MTFILDALTIFGMIALGLIVFTLAMIVIGFTIDCLYGHRNH